VSHATNILSGRHVTYVSRARDAAMQYIVCVPQLFCSSCRTREPDMASIIRHETEERWSQEGKAVSVSGFCHDPANRTKGPNRHHQQQHHCHRHHHRHHRQHASTLLLPCRSMDPGFWRICQGGLANHHRYDIRHHHDNRHHHHHHHDHHLLRNCNVTVSFVVIYDHYDDCRAQ